MGKKQKKKDEWQDDGRVIASMNIEGMPHAIYSRRSRRKFDEFGATSQKPEPITLSKREKREIGTGVGLAFAAVAIVFVIAFTLFLVFCSTVWFK